MGNSRPGHGKALTQGTSLQPLQCGRNVLRHIAVAFSRQVYTVGGAHLLQHFQFFQNSLGGGINNTIAGIQDPRGDGGPPGGQPALQDGPQAEAARQQVLRV